MSGTLNLAGLFDNQQQASFRGIEFEVATAGEPTGRRVPRFFFPGLDTTAHQDLGAMDGDLRVDAIIAGDDYVQRAQQLREAFRTAGPGTLVHPWYGERTVVLAEPCEITLDSKALRIARFSAIFQPWVEAPAPEFDTLGLVLLAIGDVKSASRAWLRDVLAPVRLGSGVLNAVAGLALWARGGVVALATGLTNGGALLSLLAPNLAGLVTLGGDTADAGYGGRVADAFDAPAATMAGTAVPAAPSAIGAGGITASPDLVLDAATMAGTLLGAATDAPAAVSVPAPVLLALQLAFLMGGVSAAVRIEFPNQTEARAWQARLDTALLGGMAAVVAAAPLGAARAAALYQALAALRAALAQDFRVGIGRLPQVRTITVPGACSVWAVANWLARDNPATMPALVVDLVARNRLRQPAAIRAGTVLEYLA